MLNDGKYTLAFNGEVYNYKEAMPIVLVMFFKETGLDKSL